MRIYCVFILSTGLVVACIRAVRPVAKCARWCKMENKLKDNVGNIEILKKAKKMGFSDKYIGEIWNKTEEEIYLLRKKENIYVN